MGAQQHQFTRDKQSQSTSNKIIPIQYQICYEKWLADPNFIYSLMSQNNVLTANILSFFPNARVSYEDFLEMVFYLRRYDPPIQRNQYAKANVHDTTLLDRFFMIMLRLNHFDQLNAIRLSRGQMEMLFMELMKLFLPHPKLGFGDKLFKFIGLENIQQATVKQYSANLREYFPHIQTHLKNYYTSKFKDMQPNGYLLKNFNSQILREDAVFLSMKLAQLTSPTTVLLYEPKKYGMSFHSIQKNLIGYTGPWLLVVQHVEKDEQGQNQVYRFGSYQSGPVRDLNIHQGDIRAFLYVTQPRIKLISTDKGSGGNFYYFINNVDQKVSKMHRGIGFGGNKDKQNFKLWLDQDLDKSTVYNGQDSTYGFGSLINPNTTKLSITKLQIWGLGNDEDIKNQQQYWANRNQQIQKRRKVNKSQFLQGDTSLMFENTFSHRDQVYGVIQTGKKQQQQQQPQYQQPQQQYQQPQQQYQQPQTQYQQPQQYQPQQYQPQYQQSQPQQYQYQYQYQNQPQQPQQPQQSQPQYQQPQTQYQPKYQ